VGLLPVSPDLHELRGAVLVWDTLDATIVLGQDIIQPALRRP
jgi:hypothetical protein